MSTQTTTIEQLVTTDTALAEAFVALFIEFQKTESAPLVADTSGVDPEFIAAIMGFTGTVEFEVSKLMISRIATNNRKLPLLSTHDTQRVVAKMLDGATMDDETTGIMALITPIATMAITGHVALLGAIDSNLYTAFWRFVAGLTNEAAASNTTLKQIVAHAEGRARVYRSLMTYPAWRRLTSKRVAMIAGVSYTDFVGGAGSFLGDDEAAVLNEELANLDIEVAPELAVKVAEVKEFYTMLGQSIWPAGNRR